MARTYGNKPVLSKVKIGEGYYYLKDADVRASAVCSLLAAVNALAAIDLKTANRFLPLIRGIN